MNNIINLQVDKEKEYIEYNGKKIRMPFKGYFNDQRMVQTTNPWSGESVFLPRFAQDVYHKIKNAELHQDYRQGETAQRPEQPDASILLRQPTRVVG